MNQNSHPPHSSLLSTQHHVECWRNGDQDALGRLCERLGPLLRHRIEFHRNWGRLRSLYSVEDVKQEVWTRVVRSGPGSFEPTDARRAFVSWLAQICDATLVDLIRQADAGKRGGGQRPVTLDSAAADLRLRRPGQARTLSPTTEARLSDFEQVARRVLTERELKAWQWVVLENYTSTEAAMGLDSSPAAVRSLLVRSRSKLQEALSKR